MELYEKLYQLRKKSGFTQSELAEKLGISRQTVSNWELGTSVPPSKRLIEISKLYQVPIDYLLNEPKVEPLDTSSLDKSILSTEHSTEPLSPRKSLLFKIKKRFFERPAHIIVVLLLGFLIGVSFAILLFFLFSRPIAQETVCEYEYENLSSNSISIPDGTDGEFDLTWD